MRFSTGVGRERAVYTPTAKRTCSERNAMGCAVCNYRLGFLGFMGFRMAASFQRQDSTREGIA